MSSYVIGIDYGSLSGRSILADCVDGRVLASAVYEYPHGIFDRELPDGTALYPDCALQHPQDYLDVLYETIPALLRESGVSPEDVVGIGVDATACTVLPVDRDGRPMCFDRRFASQSQAYIKMWKHHGGQAQADKLTRTAEALCPELLERFGGSISAESFFPKLWELWEKAPELYEAMYEYIEVADWIIQQLSGSFSRNGCAAGYKAMYQPESGYPDAKLFHAAGFCPETPIYNKMPSPVIPVGSVAGYLTPEAAAGLGLMPGTPLAAGLVDAHVCVPAAGISDTGHMLMIIGTSACHMLMGRETKTVPGICGVVAGGIMPGLAGFEAGQSSVGDLYAWFVNNCVPESYFRQAESRDISIHALLSRLAAEKRPGESGLIALDWLNGNRSTLCNYELSGMVLGLTMQTKCEDIYRSLLEATAYGCRAIIENFCLHGVEVERFIASGGISFKNPFAMQLYADILKMPVEVIDAQHGPALGSAIFAAVAAGSENGGYDSIGQAAGAMKSETLAVYTPNMDNAALYDALYREYSELYEHFGRVSQSMQRLRRLRDEALGLALTR